MTPKQLAERLSCSPRTVRLYVSVLRRVEGVAAAVRYRTLPALWVDLIIAARTAGVMPSKFRP